MFCFGTFVKSHHSTRVKNIYAEEYRGMIDRLVAFRKERNMTQVELAERLGWSRPMLTKVETYDRRLDIMECVQICRILGVKVSDVIRD